MYASKVCYIFQDYILLLTNLNTNHCPLTHITPMYLKRQIRSSNDRDHKYSQ